MRKDVTREHIPVQHGASSANISWARAQPQFFRQKKIFATQERKVKMLISGTAADITVFFLNPFLRVLPMSVLPSRVCVARKD